jgi:hypothetical protein
MQLSITNIKKNNIYIKINNKTVVHEFYQHNNKVICNIPRCASNSLYFKLKKENNLPTICLIRNIKDRLKSSFRLVKDINKLHLYLFSNKKISNHSIADELLHFVPQSFFIKHFPFHPIQEYHLLENYSKKMPFKNTTQNTGKILYPNNDSVFDDWYNTYKILIHELYASDLNLYNNLKNNYKYEIV